MTIYDAATGGFSDMGKTFDNWNDLQAFQRECEFRHASKVAEQKKEKKQVKKNGR